jgi:hypothetical protein
MNSEYLLLEEFKLKDSVVKDGTSPLSGKFSQNLSAADLYKIIVSK